MSVFALTGVFFSALLCLDLLKETPQSDEGPVLYQTNYKISILVPELFQPSQKFLPLFALVDI